MYEKARMPFSLLVSIKTGAGGESFPTDWANMWLFSCVSSHVPLQQTWSIKVFPTNIAGKHCLLFGPSTRSGSLKIYRMQMISSLRKDEMRMEIGG